MPKSQIERVWLGGTLLLGLIVALLGYFFLIGPQRDDTGQIDAQVANTSLQNSVLQARINSLAQQNTKLSSYERQLHDAKLALPTTSGLPDFLRTLQSIGGATLTDISSLTVGTPTALTSTTGATTTTTAPTTSAAPAPAAGTAPTTVDIYALPITAQVVGNPAQLSAFLGQLQSVQPRAVLVSSIVLGGDTSSAAATTSQGQTTMQLTMQAFVAPPASAVLTAPSASTGP